MLHRFVLHNRDIREVTDPLLAPGQVGLLSGWGIFTTMMVTGGVPFAWERHWARLRRDAATIHVALPYGPDEVREGLIKLAEANGAADCTARLAFVRNVGGMWAAADQARETDLIAFTADTKDWGEGARLTVFPQARHAASRFAGTKTLSWAHNLVWLEDAKAQGFDEVVLLNERGEVAECTSANIFIVERDRVLTPPLASGCLPGITRELLLTEVRVPEFPIEERTLYPADLEGADDVFITSTTRGVLGVTAVGQHAIRPKLEARHALQKAFSNYVEKYVGERRAARQA